MPLVIVVFYINY